MSNLLIPSAVSGVVIRIFFCICKPDQATGNAVLLPCIGYAGCMSPVLGSPVAPSGSNSGPFLAFWYIR